MKRDFHKIIGILILALILYKINISDVIELLLKTNLNYLVPVVFFTLPGFLIKSWRWRYLLKMQGIEYDLKNAFLAYLSSGYIGIITPGKVGEFVKVFYLKEDEKIDTGKAFSSVFADKFLDLGVLLLFGSIGIFYFPIGQYAAFLIFIPLIFAFMLLITLTNEQMTAKLVYFITYWPFLKKYEMQIERQFKHFFDATAEFKSIKLLVPVIASFIAYSIFFYQCHLMIISLGIHISSFNLIFCISIANLISLIPISISGIGTRDATLIILFSYLELSKEAAVSFSILFVFLLYLSLGVFGGIAWWLKPLKKWMDFK